MFIYYQCNYIQFIHFKQEKNNFTVKSPGRHELKRLFTFNLDFPSFLSVLNLLDTFTSSSPLWNHCHQGQYDLYKIKSNGQFSIVLSDLSGGITQMITHPFLKAFLKTLHLYRHSVLVLLILHRLLFLIVFCWVLSLPHD